MKPSNLIRYALIAICLLFLTKCSLSAQNGIFLKGAIGLSDTPPINSNHSILPFGSVVFAYGKKIKSFLDFGFQHGGGKKYRTFYITANPSFRYYYQKFYGGLGGYGSLEFSHEEHSFDYGYSVHFGYGKKKIISINLQQGLLDIETGIYETRMYKNRYVYLSYHHLIINNQKKKEKLLKPKDL